MKTPNSEGSTLRAQALAKEMIRDLQRKVGGLPALLRLPLCIVAILAFSSFPLWLLVVVRDQAWSKITMLVGIVWFFFAFQFFGWRIEHFFGVRSFQNKQPNPYAPGTLETQNDSSSKKKE